MNLDDLFPEVPSKLGVCAPEAYDFGECLERSHAASDLPFWEECYRKFFLTFAVMVDHRQNGEHQKAGIDRSVILQNSKQILIDEKVRGKNRITGRVYEDIALEEWSKLEARVPGWVVKPLLADYIAYAIAPLGVCYLLPVIQLQAAWKIHHKEWRNPKRRIESKNKGYHTLSWGVDVPVLFAAIGDCLSTTFKACEFFE